MLLQMALFRSFFMAEFNNFFLKIYLLLIYFWLRWVLVEACGVLVAACGIFHCGAQALCCSAQASL